MAPPPEVEEEVENDEVIDESFGIQSMESKSLQFDRRNRSPPRTSSSPSSPSSCFSSCSPDVDEVSSFHALNEWNSEENERNIGKASASRYGTQKETVLMEREHQHGQDTVNPLLYTNGSFYLKLFIFYLLLSMEGPGGPMINIGRI